MHGINGNSQRFHNTVMASLYTKIATVRVEHPSGLMGSALRAMENQTGT